jgi:hypothetical protein
VGALLYAFAGVTAVAWWAGGRQRGAPVVMGGSVVVQLALHGVFLLGQLLAATPAAAPSATPAAAPDPAVSTPGMGAMPGMAGPGHGGAMHEWSAGMLALHAAVALVCGLWMWRGEVALYRMLRCLAWVLAAPLRYVLAVCGLALPPAPRVRADRAARPRPVEVLLRHAVVRRGPPPLVVVI